MTREIKTTCVYPPIPIRQYDWCAYYEDEGEEAGRYGWGETEADAILDLRDNYGDE